MDFYPYFLAKYTFDDSGVIFLKALLTREGYTYLNTPYGYRGYYYPPGISPTAALLELKFYPRLQDENSSQNMQFHGPTLFWWNFMGVENVEKWPKIGKILNQKFAKLSKCPKNDMAHTFHPVLAHFGHQNRKKMGYPYFKGYPNFLNFDPYFLAKYIFHGFEVMFF